MTPRKPKAKAERKVGDSAPRRGNAGKGRKAGVPNKLTKSAREAFQYAFDKCGGQAQLAKWARTNYDEFIKLYARTIPLDLTSGNKPLVPSGVLAVPVAVTADQWGAMAAAQQGAKP